MTDKKVPNEFAENLVGEVPALRTFARSLTVNRSLADDLVQETILIAWNKYSSFTPGSNLRAWLFTILRNTFFSALAKRKREVEDADGTYADTVVQLPSQGSIPGMVDFRRALAKLPASQREALILVGAVGFSYEEAADICNAAVGTMKSRVNRARIALTGMLDLRPGDLNLVDPETMSVLSASESM